MTYIILQELAADQSNIILNIVLAHDGPGGGRDSISDKTGTAASNTPGSL